MTQPELVAAGLDPWVDPRYLQLYVDGKEQAILVTGEKDGRFDPSDAVEFYGTGLVTQFTDTRVYWLVLGWKLGERVKKGVRGFGRGGGGSYFTFTVEKKPRKFYVAAVKNGEGNNFFGPAVSMTPATCGFETVLERDYDKTALLPTADLVDAMWRVRDAGVANWREVFGSMSNVAFVGQYRGLEEDKKRIRGNFKKSRPVDFVAQEVSPRDYFCGRRRPMQVNGLRASRPNSFRTARRAGRRGTVALGLWESAVLHECSESASDPTLPVRLALGGAAIRTQMRYRIRAIGPFNQ